MKNLIYFAGVIMCTMFLGCKSKDNGPIIKFNGVTETDKFGAVVGKADSTDWRVDDKWLDKEKALFNASYNDNAPQPENLKVVFFANPCRGQSVFYIKKDSTVRLSVRLVDKDFSIVFSKDSIYDNKLLLDLNSLKTNDTLRLYYKFIDEKNNEFKGHGDIYLWLK